MIYFLSIEGQLGPRFGGHFCENHQDFHPSVTRSHVLTRSNRQEKRELMDMIDEKDYDCGLQIRDPNQQGLGRPQV